jgi:poly(A) polymerase
MKMMNPLDRLAQAGHNSAYILWSSLDSYFGHSGASREDSPVGIALTEASLPQLAGLPGRLEFPGSEWADVLWYPEDPESGALMLRCVDRLDEVPASTVVQGCLLRMPGKLHYRDPFGCYPYLRTSSLNLDTGSTGSWLDAAEIAVLLSRYNYQFDNQLYFSGPQLLPSEQRMLLMLILGGSSPERGLQFLLDCGFIGLHWPLLGELSATEQSKDFHPEGNVWAHTLAALSSRKRSDPELGLAVLLHDCGKPVADEQEGNRFHRHAQIGAARAARFLRALGFDHALTDRIHYLVTNHMVPSFLQELPSSGRLTEVLDDPLFPQLLELYRCDISSSFRGPDSYYQACKVYRSWCRERKRSQAAHH